MSHQSKMTGAHAFKHLKVMIWTSHVLLGPKMAGASHQHQKIKPREYGTQSQGNAYRFFEDTKMNCALWPGYNMMSDSPRHQTIRLSEFGTRSPANVYQLSADMTVKYILLPGHQISCNLHQDHLITQLEFGIQTPDSAQLSLSMNMALPRCLGCRLVGDLPHFQKIVVSEYGIQSAANVFAISGITAEWCGPFPGRERRVGSLQHRTMEL